MLPRFCLINARSLNQKTDKLAAFMAVNKIDIAAVRESWLHNNIDDDQIAINGYTIYRKDRLHGRGGGVCMYQLQEIPGNRRTDLENPNYECMWLLLRPILACQDLCPRLLSA